MIVSAIDDPIKLRSLAIHMLSLDRAFPDSYAPCPDACMFCDACARAFGMTVEIFEHPDTTVFAVRRWNKPECGVIFFTGSMLHGYFWDGKLWGKGRAIREAISRMMARGHTDITCQVPESSAAVGWWLQRVGFEPVGTTTGFKKHGREEKVEVLQWAL